MKITDKEKRKLYESIMKDFSKIVKNHINEMSDGLLDRAADKAEEKGDTERAEKFHTYKNSQERLQRSLAEMNKEVAAINVGEFVKFCTANKLDAQAQAKYFYDEYLSKYPLSVVKSQFKKGDNQIPVQKKIWSIGGFMLNYMVAMYVNKL